MGKAGGWLDKVKLRLTQPQVELEAEAELGNYHIYVPKIRYNQMFIYFIYIKETFYLVINTIYLAISLNYLDIKSI